MKNLERIYPGTTIQKNRYYETYYDSKLREVEKTDWELFEEKIEIKRRKCLPVEIIQAGLGTFGKTTEGSGYAFLSLDLKDKSLYSLNVSIRSI